MATSQLNHERVDIALVFVTAHYNPKLVLPPLQKILNQCNLIGCSTAGLILSDNIKTSGLSLLLITSDDLKIGAGVINNIDQNDIMDSGNRFARNCLENYGQYNRHLFLFFIDGLLKNTSTFLKGMQASLGNAFPIIGGGNCDDFHFKNTFLFYKDQVLRQAAAGVVLGGHSVTGVCSYHGWKPLGKPRIINKSTGNVINIIDNKPAAHLYTEYFGEEVENFRKHNLGMMEILYPLGIYVEGSNEYLLRNAVDFLDDGSIVCQGDVPQGAEAHIMIGNKDFCRQAAIRAAQEVQDALNGQDIKLVFIIESMARLKLLGRMAYQEILEIRNIFGASVPIFGIYTNGEIAPFQTVEKIRKSYLLNESIVITGIC
ncbi:MAG: FIST C-terminal domain-containing protein [Candidatus Omnitrophica bacterium]|nr:FIST C-terminal domain-containing protein [Candidatus Omnitrophota bacterium]